MIIGFSHHSGAGGSGPVLDYLTGYLVNGERRAVAPEVVRGDAKAVADIIDALPFQRRYTSGVCSFAAEDVVTPEIQEDIMNRFEGAAFAGIPPDRRSIVWIAHRDKGRLELHFVVPRVDLTWPHRHRRADVCSIRSVRESIGGTVFATRTIRRPGRMFHFLLMSPKLRLKPSDSVSLQKRMFAKSLRSAC